MGKAPIWLIPIATLLLLQTTSAFLNRLIPIISPALTQEFGWDDSLIGYLTAANNFGALVILLTGMPLMQRIGSIRTLQFSLLMGSASVCLFFFPMLTLALLASLLLGVSQGVASPAGSDVLQRFSPPQSRNLVFSIKQAGVPLGGVVAGLLIPFLVVLMGWRGALACAGLLVAGGIWWTWRWREQVDEPAEKRKAPPRSHRSVIQPLRSLASRSGLLRMALAGVLMAANQSCWFAFMVTYLIVKLQYSLVLAGAVFAVMQASSVAGRIILGWLADSVASPRVILMAAAVISAVVTLLLALAEPGWPLWVVMVLSATAGMSVSGWNGVQIAEIARRSAPGQVAETAAGASILLNCGNMAAPTLFSLVAGITGRLDYSLWLTAAFSALATILLARVDKSDKTAI
jgi:predicted MFS family arabinose efflux permease